MTRSSWMKLHLGDKVVHGDELKHVGTVESIKSSYALVRWENGWLSEIFCNELKKAEGAGIDYPVWHTI